MTAPPGWPAEGGVLHRSTGRVLPVRTDGRVLLLHGWVPERPQEPFWFTVGGAVDDGESLRDAAARELREEAGIEVAPVALGEPITSNTIEFWWGGRRIIQAQTFFAVAVGAAVAVSFDGLDELERATTDDYGWFTSAELRAHPHSGIPDLPRLIDLAVARVRD